MVEADVVRAAGRPVLHVTQICVPVDEHVSAAEEKKKTKHSTSGSLHASPGRWRRSFFGGGALFSLPEGAHLQSREALWRATEKEVIPPCSSPSRGEGEMLEHSR